MINGLINLLRDQTNSSGQKLDELIRTVRLRRWRQLDKLQLRAFGTVVDLAVRKGSTDHEVVYQCFIENQFEIPTLRGVRPTHANAIIDRYEAVLAAGRTPVILDCGANIGASTAWFLAKYPRCTVVAVEPAPDNVALLSRNVGKRPNVEIVAAGIGASDTQSFLQDAGGGHWGYQTGDTPSGIQIQLVSVSTLMEQKPADQFEPLILKLDIEGAELPLFKGSWDAMNKFPLIIIEPHDFCMPNQQTSNSFFRFHAETNREFLFGHENIFSFRTDLLMPLETLHLRQY